jgi:protein TonB
MRSSRFIITLLLLSFLATTEVSAQEIDGNIFQKVEVEASFPGKESAWKTYLQTNLRADVPVRKKAKVGTYTVIIQFLVEKDGSLSEFKALTNHGHGMEKEVIRILKKSPKWEPAYQNGRPVRAYRKQPVTFQVVNE